MKKNMSIIGLSVLFLLSIILIVGLYSENRSLKESLSKSKIEINQYAEIEERNEEKNLQEKIKFIETAFSDTLTYTNREYGLKNKKATQYFTSESNERIQGVGSDMNPSVKMESSNSKGNVYRDLNIENQFMYVTQVTYKVEENEAMILEHIYQFKILEKNKEYKIDHLEIIPKQPTIY